MVWAFSAENVSNVKNYFINFCNAVFAYILNNTVIFPTFLGGFRGPYIYIYIYIYINLTGPYSLADPKPSSFVGCGKISDSRTSTPT